MITNAAIRKEIKEEKEKISLMKQEDVLKYLKVLIKQASKILNQENNLLRKKKYAQIKEDTAWQKLKLINVMFYCLESFLKFKDAGSLKDELNIINKDFASMMTIFQENKRHIMRVVSLQQIALDLHGQSSRFDMTCTFGYDDSSRHIASKNFVKYSKPINTNQYI
jgi:hypothetical protein